VELRVAQSGLCHAVKRRRRDNIAECAWCGEPDIVGHDEKDVRRTLRRHHARRPPDFRLQCVFFDNAAKLRIGRRELLTIDSRCGVGRAGHPSRLLGRCRNAVDGEKACAQKKGDEVDFVCGDSGSHGQLPELVVT